MNLRELLTEKIVVRERQYKAAAFLATKEVLSADELDSAYLDLLDAKIELARYEEEHP